MNKSIIPKIILLFVITLFLVEYLNPSVIGVRADYKPAPVGASPSGSPATAGSEAPTATPHFMIQTEVCRPGEYFPSRDYISLFQSLTEQTSQKEIFHPPAFTL